MTDQTELIKAIAVTAELTGTELSEAAKQVMVQDLSTYPLEQVIPALNRCRQELKGKLTIADVVNRLQDGRPGPEEAWALTPKSEDDTVVWTNEMCQAWGVAEELLGQGKDIQARLVFIEKYKFLVAQARANRESVKWTPSIGHNKEKREPVLMEAARLGRLPVHQVQALLPHSPDINPAITSKLPPKLLGKKEGAA